MTKDDPPASNRSADDAGLVACFLSGRPECFEELVLRHEKGLQAYLANRMPNPEDVKEVVQETFIRVYCHLDRYDPAQKFSTWLYTIATNLMFTMFRRDQKRGIRLQINEEVLGLPADTGPGLEADKLWDLAARLPALQYQVLTLRYQKDRTLAQIAEQVGKNPNTVRMLLQKACKQMREMLQEKKGQRI